MSGRSRQNRLRLAILMLLVTFAPTAGAHFERVTTSSRTEALGRAFIAVADDANSAWFNAAGLANLDRFEILATYRRPYSVGDVDEGYAAIAVPSPTGVVGASWFYRGLQGVMGENLLTLSFGRDLVRTVEDASLSVGANIDYSRVSVSDRFNQSDGAVTFGLSAHMRPFPMIGVGYAVRNLNESTLHLVPGGVGTELRRRHSWGLSYFWARRLILSFERRQDSNGDWRDHGGMELRLGRLVALRSGLDGRYATMGMGIVWSGVAFDVGVSSHASLGASYIFTIGYGPPRPVNLYEQTP